MTSDDKLIECEGIGTDRIIVSFCIPTYNRAPLVKRCIEEVLKIDSPQIEIVVVDNASPDDTENVIGSIKDGRISYFRNQSNIGSAMNVVRTILKAKGDWVFLLSDEDFVNVTVLNDIINGFSNGERTNLAVLLGNVKKNNELFTHKYENKFFSKGDEAVCGIGFSHYYLSGILINKKFLNVNELTNFTPDDGIYPHVNIYTRACIFGDAETMNFDFCSEGGWGNHKSYVEKPNNEYFFHPKNRFTQFKIFANMANGIIEDREKRAKMLGRLFNYYLNASTNGYECTIKSSSIKDHHGISGDPDFDYWAEFDKFATSATDYLEGIVQDQHVKKILWQDISKFLIKFRLKGVTRYIPEPVKNIIRTAYRSTFCRG